jgi:hypothetical protein
VIYFFIGCITGLISLKRDGKALDKLDTDDIVMPLFLWPFICIFCIGWGIAILIKKSFEFLAIYVFKIPSTTSFPTSTEPSPFPVFQEKIELERKTPPKETEPQEEIPRTSLIDID